MRSRLALRLLPLLAAGLLACRGDSPPTGPDGSPTAYNPDWSTATHGKVAPNYGVVFPQAAVNTIELTMTAAQWASIRTDMTARRGHDFGARPSGGVVAPGADDPPYVDLTVRFNGKQWKHVGFRLKGNASLASAWGQGIYKLPFRLQFDEFEDRVPAIDDQRFHGFKELSFSPGHGDFSLVREKVAADLLRTAGIPAARTAFYRVTIDFGDGPRYCGVYTAVEVIDDTMVEEQFGDDAGNIYKPESQLRTFVQREWEKKNNEATPSWADVQAFIAALNSPLRTTDAARWRAGLEATFDADHFVKWLAVNTSMANWDSYGAIAHNYYLYHHPTRKLVWIPWDHNLAFIGNPGVTGTPSTSGAPTAFGLSMTMNEVRDDWPLLRHVADDPVYMTRYRAYVRDFADGPFTEPAMDAMVDRYHALIAPHVVGPNGERPGATFLPSEAAFTAAGPALKAHLRARRAVIAAFLQ
ncbi:MAG: CotH kinase family protein [Gemmatirosa sp.]